MAGLLNRVLMHKTPQERLPLWFMRQAGRYLPEYRALRQQAGDFLSLCLTPDYAAEVTLQPLRRFDLDAAIIFADILLIPMTMGQGLAFAEGEGPILTPSLMDKPDWHGHEPDIARLYPVSETVRRVKKSVNNNQDVIGFAGAPWTVLTYMIRGHKRRSLSEAVVWAQAHPERTRYWLERLTLATQRYLADQITAGAAVIQIFDTWAGVVPTALRTQWLYTPASQISQYLAEQFPHIPVIYFGKGLGADLKQAQAIIKADGLGLDSDCSLSEAVQWFDSTVVLQGNLSPDLLRAGGFALSAATTGILDYWQSRPAIFNLGHGILPDTPIAHVEQMLAIVRNQSI